MAIIYLGVVLPLWLVVRVGRLQQPPSRQHESAVAPLAQSHSQLVTCGHTFGLWLTLAVMSKTESQILKDILPLGST